MSDCRHTTVYHTTSNPGFVIQSNMAEIKPNPAQAKAIAYGEGPLLIIAGAGTGKTTVLTQRIIHLVSSGIAKPEEILALTFTEKAANEMQERVDVGMPYGYAEMWVSTFHSFADRILRKEASHVGMSAEYTLLTPELEYTLFKKHLYQLPFENLRPQGNPSKNIIDILQFFSRLQDENIRPAAFAKYVRKDLPKEDREEEFVATYRELSDLYFAFTEIKIRNSSLSFGDLIIRLLDLFEKRPDILKKYSEQFRFVLVDEFQDTNYAQNVLVNTLMLGNDYKRASKARKAKANITVVGDDDQAIYKFRGAAVSNIMGFTHLYDSAEIVVLSDNYRSVQEILDAGYALVQGNNPERLEKMENINKKLISHREVDQNHISKAIQVYLGAKAIDESEWIVKQVLKLTGRSALLPEGDQVVKGEFDRRGQGTFLVADDPDADTYSFKDIAVLVRANAHADPIIQIMRYYGVPYKFGGQRSLYTRPEVAYLLSFLRVMADPEDDKHMFNLITHTMWGLTPDEAIFVMHTARKKRIAVWDLLLDEQGTLAVPAVRQKLDLLLTVLRDGQRDIVEHRPLTRTLYNFVSDSGFLAYLASKDENMATFQIRNVSSFFDTLKNFEQSIRDATVFEYIDFVEQSMKSGRTPKVGEDLMEDLDAVNIMTVHGAKGLEFPVVFMPSLVEGRFPTSNRRPAFELPDALVSESEVPDDPRKAHIAEERRLFYVGMTRAKEKLYMTAAQLYAGGKRKSKLSRFVVESLPSRQESLQFDLQAPDTSTTLQKFDIPESDNIVDYGILPDDQHLFEVFSYSQLSTYETCPKRYLYAYVYKVPTPPSASLSFGSTIHKSLQNFYEIYMDERSPRPGLEDLLKIYEDVWVGEGYDNAEHEETRKTAGRRVLEDYYEKFHNDDLRPLAVERKFTLKFDDIGIIGSVDRIDRLGEEEGKPVVELIDYKTGKIKSASEIKKDMQLKIYALASEMVLGYKVAKASYIFVESGEKVSVELDEDTYDEVKDKVLSIVAKIRSKDFRATPNPYKCKFCPYKDICPDAMF